MALSPAVQAYTEAAAAKFTEIAGSIDTLGTAHTGIAGDVAFLKAKLEAINNSPGTLSAEDQSALDLALARLGVLATRTEAAKTAAQAIDDATAPDELPTPPTA